MLDLSNSVILPRDDYIELNQIAWGQTTTTAERVAGTVQTTIIVAVFSAAAVGVTWAWARAMEKLEDKKLANDIAAAEAKQKIYDK